ncbi:hypothetical protein V1509DRAFT_554603, partial [Lipomyces kononenkoae]
RILYLGLGAFLCASRATGISVDDCFSACGSAVVFASQCGADTSCLCSSGSGFMTTATTCLDCAGPNGANIWEFFGPSMANQLVTCGLPTTPGGTPASNPTASTPTVTSTSVITSTITTTVVMTTSS